MRKLLLLAFTGLLGITAIGQQSSLWKLSDEAAMGTDVFAASNSKRPSAYKIFSLNEAAFRNLVRLAPSEKNVTVSISTFIVAFPMPDGQLARFRIVEAPCMAPELSAKFPGIKSYAGKGIDDPSANIRFDISHAGVSASIISAKQSTVYIDKLIGNYYRVVYRKDMTASIDRFQCLTDAIPHPSTLMPGSDLPQDADDGKLRTYRLAMISGAEFSLHFIPPGGLPTLADSIAAVLAAQNSHITRTNQVYERDFGVRLVLVANNNLIIYFDPATDPIANPNAPNGVACMAAIDGAIGNGNYDIGHTESKGSDNGNAGCIGCVCNNTSKGRGWTVYGNPSLLEFFVIDYLTHEMGHQFGANHTFSFNVEGTGVSVEPGSGVTIMGYAGIVPGQNVALHSIELFSVKSIEQVTNYIKSGGGSGCDQETVTGNSTPTANAGADYNIPHSTPFKLTGIGTDADPGDVLTYNWEQIDSRSGAFPSIPISTATDGPMFRTYLSYTIPERTFPELQYILTGANGFMWEVLPSVGRNLNFRFIVKDNHPGGGNNKTDNMVVTTAAAIGPFLVTAPNTTGITWNGGTSQTVTWSVNGSTGAPVNCANVNILLSTDGGNTWPITLAAGTANDGTENITVPAISLSTTCRVKVEAVGNIFFDINNANFTVAPPPSGFTFNTVTAATASCPAPATMQTNLTATFNGGFSNPVTLTASGNPGGTTVLFGTNPLLPGTPTTTVTLTNTNTLSFGTYTIQVTGTASGAPPQTQNISYVINASTGPSFTGHPASQTVCQGSPVSFSITATGAISYQWQKSTDGGANWNNIGGATATTYSIGSAQPTDAGLFRCVASGQCGATNSNNASLTVNTPPAITGQPTDITICAGSNHTFTVTATGTGISYQWQSATSCAGAFTNIGGATSPSLTVTAGTTTAYRCVVTGTCTPVATSNCALMTVINPVTVSSSPSNVTVCEGGNASFTAAGNSSQTIVYQWQISTDGGANYTNISGANAATYIITGVTFAMNNNRYRCQMSNATCTSPAITTGAILTVNTLPAVTGQPSNSTICAGSNTSFSVTATGTAVTYQWQLSTDGGANYSNIGGATAATYNVTGATVGMNNYRYRCIVSGTCTPAVTSSAAILTVIAPVSVTTQPSNSEVCSGSNTSFTVAGSSTLAIIYQWQVSTDGGANYSNISGATSATYTLNGVTTALNNNRYRCQMSNATCTTPTSSNGAILTVRQLPSIGLTASANSLLPGKTSILTATPSPSTGGTVTTAWFFNNNPVANVGNTRVVNVEQVGTYRVAIAETWTSGLICANQSPVVTIDATVSDKLFIFPSPNDGRFTVSYYNNGGTSTQRRIVIIDSKGAKVYERQFPISGAYTLLNIDLRGGARGIYYVLVGDATGAKLASGKVHVR